MSPAVMQQPSLLLGRGSIHPFLVTAQGVCVESYCAQSNSFNSIVVVKSSECASRGHKQELIHTVLT